MTYEEYAELRDKKGVCDADVARATGIDKATFSKWKAGVSKPKQDKVDKILYYIYDGHYVKNQEELVRVAAESFLKDNLPNYGGIIDVETQILLRNNKLHELLLAGGRCVGEHPEVIDAMIYTLNKMSEQ